MKRDYVDFSIVPDAQVAIHMRLENWARWQYNRPSGAVQPMFRLYRAPPQWDGAVHVVQTVDRADAQRIQKQVSALPARHRLAVSWCYIKRDNPRRAAQTIGESLQGLAHLVSDARQMLINRVA